MKYLIFCIVLFSGCNETKIKHDGTVCYKGTTANCGVHLWNCANGSEYYCVTNVKELPNDKD